MVVMIAAGVGITPMRSLLAALPPASGAGELHLLYRVSSEQDLVFREELDHLAAERGGDVHYLVGGQDDFLDGNAFGARQLTELVPDIRHADVYLCGPDPVLDTAIEGLRDAGVPSGRIHTERFLL